MFVSVNESGERVGVAKSAELFAVKFRAWKEKCRVVFERDAEFFIYEAQLQAEERVFQWWHDEVSRCRMLSCRKTADVSRSALEKRVHAGTGQKRPLF